ncbi:unnamed protein product [Peronospora farinosa]|uniref:Uncharacterized protein n=1 Tax=Peronospora farinosa TaxID=134698 RepID=A0ABN8C1U3_9STRA|nr:unnamed protein product [Peronospora farinosa]
MQIKCRGGCRRGGDGRVAPHERALLEDRLSALNARQQRFRRRGCRGGRFRGGVGRVAPREKAVLYDHLSSLSARRLLSRRRWARGAAREGGARGSFICTEQAMAALADETEGGAA